MLVTPQNRTSYNRIFTAATAIRELQPWNWMGDAECVITNDPNDPDNYGQSIMMGGGGEVFGVAVYVGPVGMVYLEKMFRFAELGADMIMDRWSMFIHHTFKLEFVSRDEVKDIDRQLCKELSSRTLLSWHLASGRFWY
jgi:hypothetical protein